MNASNQSKPFKAPRFKGGGSVKFANGVGDTVGFGFVTASRALTISNIGNVQSPVRRAPGSIWAHRMQGRGDSISKRLFGQYPESYSNEQLIQYGVHQNVINVRCDNAERFIFASDHLHRINEISDDSNKISSNPVSEPLDSSLAENFTFFEDINLDSLTRSFMALPSVDRKLVNHRWLMNHCKWIIWKLAALEVAFPLSFANRQLTPKRIIDQLKYRYDREIDLCHRSSIKKIAEGDDSSSRRAMILCVSQIDYDSRSNAIQIRLTDGWYEVGGILDAHLSALVSSRRIAVGVKLFINGATLTGKEDSCDPLNIPHDASLMLEYNSTRRARWWSKLGYYMGERRRLDRSMPLAPTFPIDSLKSGAGHVSLNCLLCRIYPLLYVEKRDDGVRTTRNEADEQVAASRFEQKLYDALEKLVHEISGEIDTVSGTQLTESQTADIVLDSDNGEHLYIMAKKYVDPSQFTERLTTSQANLLNSYMRRKKERDEAERRASIEQELKQKSHLLPKRNVTPTLKMLVIDLRHPLVTNIAITVYNATPELQSELVEGQAFYVDNLQPFVRRLNDETTDIDEKLPTVALSANARSKFVKLVISTRHPAYGYYQPRENCAISELLKLRPSKGVTSSEWIDIDFTAAVVDRRTDNDSYTIYCCDEEFNFLSLRLNSVFSSVSKGFMYKAIAVLNARFNTGKRWMVPRCYANETTVITTNPSSRHLVGAFNQLSAHIHDNPSFIRDACRRLSKQLGVSGSDTIVSPVENGSCTPIVSNRISRRSSFGMTPSLHPLDSTLLGATAAGIVSSPPIEYPDDPRKATLIYANSPSVAKRFKPPTRPVL